MDSGLYAACAGLVARSHALEISANNLANVNASGYRGQKPVFSTILESRTRHPLAPANQTINAYGVLSHSRVDRTQGSLDHTGSPLDLAIEGSGFFEVSTPEGIRYTRNGSLHLSPGGDLVTTDGHHVLGVQGAIRLPHGSISVSPEGTISVDGALAGKLRLVEFPPSVSLIHEGASLYSAPPGSSAISHGSAVKQGYLENSNVNPVIAAVELIDTQRQAEMLYRTLNAFHGELNKTAVEDLTRA